MNAVSAESVRQAVITGDYDRALSLWQQYTAEMAAAEPTRESLAEAAELIEWARPVLESSRSQAVERLTLLHVASQYGRTTSRPRPQLRESF
jgi:hypothetical protein